MQFKRWPAVTFLDDEVQAFDLGLREVLRDGLLSDRLQSALLLVTASSTDLIPSRTLRGFWETTYQEIRQQTPSGECVPYSQGCRAAIREWIRAQPSLRLDQVVDAILATQNTLLATQREALSRVGQSQLTAEDEQELIRAYTIFVDRIQSDRSGLHLWRYVDGTYVRNLSPGGPADVAGFFSWG